MSAHFVLVRLENNRRDRVHGPNEMDMTEEALQHALTNDLTDGENPRFRYVT